MGGKKHYNKAFVRKIINPLIRNNFDCYPLPNSKNKYSISRDDGPRIIVHGGESCINPLRRDLKNFYNYKL